MAMEKTYSMIKPDGVANGHIGEIVNRGLEEGLIIITAGSNVLRFVPPLVVTEADVDEMITKLEKCF